MLTQRRGPRLVAFVAMCMSTHNSCYSHQILQSEKRRQSNAVVTNFNFWLVSSFPFGRNVRVILSTFAEAALSENKTMLVHVIFMSKESASSKRV